MKRGFTLVELVMALVILALAIPALLSLFAVVTKSYVQSEEISRANQLGHSLMEEVISQRFDELLQRVGGDWTETLGPEEATRVEYDDVDDYHGFSEPLTGDFFGFTRSVTVEYIPEPVVAWLGRWEEWLVGSAFANHSTDYKKITVTVVAPTGIPVTLTGLATPLNFQQIIAQAWTTDASDGTVN